MTGMAVTTATTQGNRVVQVWDLDQKVQGWIKPPHCVATMRDDPEQKGDRLTISGVCREEWLPDVIGLFRAFTAGLPITATHTARYGYTRADIRIEPVVTEPEPVDELPLFDFGGAA